MTCNNCSNYNNKNNYQEFIPNHEYKVGDFFKIGSEVFKVVEGDGDDCTNCDVWSNSDAGCHSKVCSEYERDDGLDVFFILYDNISEDSLDD